jgi:hypothetical protein
MYPNAKQPRKARIVKNIHSQGAREGLDAVLSTRPSAWSLYLEAPLASATFMEEVEDLPVQERRVHQHKS